MKKELHESLEIIKKAGIEGIKTIDDFKDLLRKDFGPADDAE